MGTGNGSALEFTLCNGRRIPRLGFSTVYLPAEDTARTVETALGAGYRYLEAGSAENEPEMGRGLRAAGTDREKLFLSGKAWNAESYQDVVHSFQLTTAALGTGYLDLYLLPWPERSLRAPDWERAVRDSWQAMTELYAAGRVKAIGVSGFGTRRLTPLLNAKVQPMTAQAGFRPGRWDRDLLLTCMEHGILLQGLGPASMEDLRDHSVLCALSEKYGCTVQQLWMRWCLQSDVLPLVCPAGAGELEEYAGGADFILCDRDRERLSALPPELPPAWNRRMDSTRVRRAC